MAMAIDINIRHLAVLRKIQIFGKKKNIRKIVTYCFVILNGNKINYYNVEHCVQF